MLSAIFGGLGDVVGANGFIGFLKNLLSSIITLFYTAPTGSETQGSLTDFGILFIAVVGIGFVFWGLSWISKLMKLRG